MSEPQRWELPRWGRVLAVVVVAVVAYSAGRFSAPAEVEEQIRVQTIYKDRIVEKRVEVRGKDRIVYIDRTITPDGTIKEKVIEKEQAKETITSDRTADRQAEQVREVIKRVEVRPDWRVAVMAGATLKDPLVPIAGPLVLGVEVDRRIIGGVSAGIWASTQGAAGLSLGVEF